MLLNILIYIILQNNIRLTIELGGWEMVDSPEKADKRSILILRRDYFTAKLHKYLEKKKKGIKFTSLESGNKIRYPEANNKGKNNGSHIVLDNHFVMNLADTFKW